MAETKSFNDKELLTSVEAAEYLGYKISSIYSLVQERRIPHYKPGGRLLFKRSELKNWVELSRVETVSEYLGENEKGTD